jgi:Phosphotransferase enzyme family
VAADLGENFAELHSSTFRKFACETFFREKYRTYWSARGRSPEVVEARAIPTPNFLGGLKRITPEMFCVIPTDALKFFRFYQRYPEIGAAIESLNQSLVRDCVVHDDPRFANFLLHDSQSVENPSDQAKVQLIDWEKWTWGDPSYDLGQLIANYLKLWLESLPVSASLDLASTLSQAKVPLSVVQASIAALIGAYLEKFPQILTYRPDFLVQLMQFTGLGLIRQVQLYISHKHPLGNVEMAMVQVAKSLLCKPEASIPTVFGQSKAAMESAVGEKTLSTVNQQ